MIECAQCKLQENQSHHHRGSFKADGSSALIRHCCMSSLEVPIRAKWLVHLTDARASMMPLCLGKERMLLVRAEHTCDPKDFYLCNNDIGAIFELCTQHSQHSAKHVTSGIQLHA